LNAAENQTFRKDRVPTNWEYNCFLCLSIVLLKSLG
jgi:hypothetical protein